SFAGADSRVNSMATRPTTVETSPRMAGASGLPVAEIRHATTNCVQLPNIVTASASSSPIEPARLSGGNDSDTWVVIAVPTRPDEPTSATTPPYSTTTLWT